MRRAPTRYWTLPVALSLTIGYVAGAEETEEVIEEVEVLEVVDSVDVTDGDSTPRLSLAQIIGRNHAAAVHLPIGLIVGVVLLELIPLFFPGLPLGKSGLVLSIAAALSLLPAAISGWMRSREVYASSPLPELFVEHRNLAIFAAVVFVGGLALRLIKKDRLEGPLRWVYLGLLGVAVLLIAAAGHHGGQLVYGENFLPY